MTFLKFLEQHSLSKTDCTVCQSKKSTYSGTNTKIVFVRLNKSIDNQDYLVLSSHAATAVAAKDIKMSQLEASYDEDYGWGLIMPPSFEELDVEW